MRENRPTGTIFHEDSILKILKFRRIPEQITLKDLDKKILKMINKLVFGSTDVSLKSTTINVVSNFHHLGPIPTPSHPPWDILVKYRDWVQTLVNKKLKSFHHNSSNPYKNCVNEALTRKRLQLFTTLRRCIRSHQEHSFWTLEGNFCGKKLEQEKKIHINSKQIVSFKVSISLITWLL